MARLSRNKHGSKFLDFIGIFSILKRNLQNTYNAMGTTFVIRLVEAVRMMVLFKAFGISLPFHYFILLESVWLFLSPFMITPGGIGAVESGRIVIYSMLPQFSAASVVPAVFIDRFITFWLMIVLGIVATMAYTRGGTGALGDLKARSLFGLPSPKNETM
jgi:uncharacterized protein (TIRG00374 family)